jgi:hypothetical protein
MQVESPGGGQVALKVHGVARIPAPHSVLGSVVNILTVAGTVVLDGGELIFEKELEPVFETAGFMTAGAEDGGSRRRLMGE